MPLPTLLVVDSDEAIRLPLTSAFQKEFNLVLAKDLDEGLAMIEVMMPEVAVLNLALPPNSATPAESRKALQQILAASPRTKVIILTGPGQRQQAIAAIRLLRRALDPKGIEHEREPLIRDREQVLLLKDILGASPSMQQIFTTVHRVAKTDATVLIEGENGTGKELIAGAIHRCSRRGQEPFVAVNCGAIPPTLMESELFGHDDGGVTGAHIRRPGKLELAHCGTVFLDEVGELSVLLQLKLLRFLQERTVERGEGGGEPVELDIRLIAATNHDVKEQLRRGSFRHDLYYRLSVVTIRVPPLRECVDELVPLANAFLRRAEREHRRRARFSPRAIAALMAYSWPGNLRELENKISRAVVLAKRRVIEPADMDLASVVAEPPTSLREARVRAERETLMSVLTRHRGNITSAARELKVSRPTLHSLLGKFNLNAKAFR